MPQSHTPPAECSGKRCAAIRAASLSYGVAALVFLVLFLLNWFVVEKYFPAPSAAVERATAVISSQAYQSKARDKIAVLELNDPYLQWLETTWPPSYALYQSMLEDVAQHAPRSIFLDIALVHSRSDSGVAALIESLCAITRSGIPVYLAAMKDADKGLYLRSELMEAARQKAVDSPQSPPCFQLVDVAYKPDEGTHLATSYPLTQPYPSAAFAIASDVWLQDCMQQRRRTVPAGQEAAYRQDCQAQIHAQALPKTMSLTWGMDEHLRKPYPQWTGCALQPKFWWELLPQPLRKAWSASDTLVMPCPFHEHVPLRMIADPHSDEEFNALRKSLEGRHVMIGAVVRGINDMVNAPIQGYIPGVYLHAMALDNLLTDYPHIKSGDAPQQAMPLGGWLIAALVAWVCFLIHELGRITFLLDSASTVLRTRAGATYNYWYQRAGQETMQLLRWLGFKCCEIASSLFISSLVFGVFLKFEYSIQTLAQVIAVVFGLQWTGITAKVYESMRRIFDPSPRRRNIHVHQSASSLPPGDFERSAASRRCWGRTSLSAHADQRDSAKNAGPV